MPITVNVAGQVGQIKLSSTKALWPLFETVVNSIQSLEDTDIPIEEKKIVIDAIRPEEVQTRQDSQGNIVEDPAHFVAFQVTDNGNGFNKTNYQSFLEAYSQLKVKRGCKGIGRFLWLKAFDRASINSTYYEDGKYHLRSFDFTLEGVRPEQNNKILDIEDAQSQTIVSLLGFKNPYRDSVAYNLESLAKKLIEHCLPYFITGACPQIILQDNRGENYNLVDYYNEQYKDSLNQDELEVKGENYTLYHMLLSEGADKHELHFCANSREVKSYDLSKHILNMQRKLSNGEKDYYYVGYLAGEYLDQNVNTERSDFDFLDEPLFGKAGEDDILKASIEFIRAYLVNDLSKVADVKKKQIDRLVKTQHPKYRLLLNKRPEVYDEIPAGLSDDKLDLELYKHQQKWEMETAQKKHDIEKKVKQNATSDVGFKKLFDEYCESITDLSRASLSEYVAHRKAVIDLLEEALESDSNDKYSKESRIHSIICPMQSTSDDIPYDDMNLWLIDDKLSYHHFLASDKKIKSIPVLENDTDKRMDIAVFDSALSYTADPDNISSITIVELKRPQRNDLDKEDTDPITQVYDYVTDIKDGKVKKKNGRDFGNVANIAFYCYVIADITPTLKKSAGRAGLISTQDGEGFFGYNPTVGTYIEVISYDKLLKDAKQRNKVLFDKLFEPKVNDLKHPEMLDQE